jgi:hypothetical protein
MIVEQSMGGGVNIYNQDEGVVVEIEIPFTSEFKI